MTTRPGRIVRPNGTSSSGKTSLVRALQARLPEPWLEVDTSCLSPEGAADRIAAALGG